MEPLHSKLGDRERPCVEKNKQKMTTNKNKDTSPRALSIPQQFRSSGSWVRPGIGMFLMLQSDSHVQPRQEAMQPAAHLEIRQDKALMSTILTDNFINPGLERPGAAQTPSGKITLPGQRPAAAHSTSCLVKAFWPEGTGSFSNGL